MDKDADDAITQAFELGRAAGFRDGIEKAAAVCDDAGPATQDMTSTFICEALERAATAIRALQPPTQGDRG